MLHVDDSPPTVKISKAMRSAAMSHIEASTVDDSGTSGTFSYYVSSGTDGVMPALALESDEFEVSVNGLDDVIVNIDSGRTLNLS
ncbi:hypothetical protein HZH66_004410 [Vespula vulgaris]|uniref:Uncharacterized protein n=2 Tax=Vespula TaxID=7451 RepID=A0A834P9D6_VESPE|nr:hypothetical protein HZH66_004410 [Vespula vulgaris]KAF7432448.1 hypothetical protein H0235_005372 [Vespula pensylvanica]